MTQLTRDQSGSKQVIKDEKKVYLIQRKIRCGMISTFILSLIAIIAVSIFFFFYFLNETLSLSVESIYYSHIFQIVQDIIQVKKNDFMLAQNELKIGSALIQDLIDNTNFNKKSLAGSKLDKLDRFNKLCGSLQKYLKKNETYDTKKVQWFVPAKGSDKTNLVNFDNNALFTNILLRLNNENISSDYTEFTQEQIDDIITCAASWFVRSDYVMNYDFSDLAKEKNFIGFQSGVVCFYPNYNDSTGKFLDSNYTENICKQERFFKKNFQQNDSQPLPTYFDPRCRPWYEEQYEKEHSTFTDVYTYNSGQLGLTNCVPLYKSITGEKQYKGAYCLDFKPTSGDKTFIQKYFSSQVEDGDGHVNYLIFTEDEQFKNQDFSNSNFSNYLTKFIFDKVSTDGKEYTIGKITLEDKSVSGINVYIQKVIDNSQGTIQADQVAMLPEKPIRLGKINVQQDGNSETYLFFLDTFSVDLIQTTSTNPISQIQETQLSQKNYTFMLVMPQSIIDKKINEVKSEVTNDITRKFIVPFVVLSIVMMIITAFLLIKISEQITSPIIELYEKIKQIINTHQKEKDQLIEKHQQQAALSGSSQLAIRNQMKRQRNTQEFDIMLHYKPRNNEINVLYLAFSNLTKTIKVARESLYEGDDNQALLDYHEVASIFFKLNNNEKYGSCMNNLGCIYLKKNQFEKAIEYLQASIEIQKKVILEMQDKSDTYEKESQEKEFVKACRHYNKGLAAIRLIMSIVKEHLKFLTVTQFSQQASPQLEVQNSYEHKKNDDKPFEQTQKIGVFAISKKEKQSKYKEFKSNHRELSEQLKKAYDEMIESFNDSMLYLSKDIFFDNDDDNTKFANDDDTNITLGNKKKNSSAIEKKIPNRFSHFQDFLLIQMLMILEIDIILGVNKNFIRPLMNRFDFKSNINTEFKSRFNLCQSDDYLKEGNNKDKVLELENQIGEYIKFIGDKEIPQNENNEQGMDETPKVSNEKNERFGLQFFRKDHLQQYISYLKGLQLEIEIGDFYGAKRHYIDALTQTPYVNHRIRKQTLERLLYINHKIQLPKESPEKLMLSRYYIKQKYVQVILDTSSFAQIKHLKSTMNLPKMLFQTLAPNDYFGLRILKNGYNILRENNQNNTETISGLLRSKQVLSAFMQDVIILEEKNMNESVKMKYIDDFTEDLTEINKLNQKNNKISANELSQKNKAMTIQTTLTVEKTINKLRDVENFKIEKINGEWIEGPMKWLVLIFGPNNQAKDLKNIMLKDYRNLNIIVILVLNKTKLFSGNDQASTALKGTIANIPAQSNTMSYLNAPENPFLKPGKNTINKGFLEAPEQQTKRDTDQGELDPTIKTMNELCRQTNEGFMITIDQKSFEVKENAEISVVGTAQTQKTVKNDLAGKSVLSKEVDKIFTKVCQSMELYTADNVPIITEFLEF